jgi:rhamnose utilization protein RhaD (predicted bifunctional aldolase and dehydrogenase)
MDEGKLLFVLDKLATSCQLNSEALRILLENHPEATMAANAKVCQEGAATLLKSAEGLLKEVRDQRREQQQRKARGESE